MYKLRFCLSCNLYRFLVQVSTYTNSLYELHLVQVDLYQLQYVQILDLYQLQHMLNMSLFYQLNDVF